MDWDRMIIMTTEPNQYRGPVPKPGPPPGPELCSEPGPDAMASSPPGTSTKHQHEVGGGEVVDKAVAQPLRNERGDSAVRSRSDHSLADPETGSGHEYLWSCKEGHTYRTPHALASHSGKSGGKVGDHSPLGMVDVATSKVVWKWSTTKEAYGLHKRLRAGETLDQALAGAVVPPVAGHTRLRSEETLTSATTETTPTTSSLPGAITSEMVGTRGPQAGMLGGVVRPELWWLDPKLRVYYDMVKDGIASQGKNYTDSFSKFIYNAVVGFLIEHSTELGLGPSFIGEAQRRVQKR